MRIKDLTDQCERMLTDRSQLLSLWQEIAENFYPQRADFTVRRWIGDEFAENLLTSFPIIVHRDLADSFDTMLRPTGQEWFHIGCKDEERETNDAKKWLERAAKIQRRVIYDTRSGFIRATKEGDYDYSAFGQTALSVRLNKDRNGLLHRCWHLRDMAWNEGEDGDMAIIVRKWKPYYIDLVRLFGDKVSSKVKEKVDRQPFEQCECYHIIVRSDLYDEDSRGRPYFSISWDKDHDHVMESVAQWSQEYIIPRWQTVSGSQYAYSPAAIAALPDARLIQSMTYTLMEAGEKAVNPPIVATQDAVRSDVALYAGGLTWVSEDYDERFGAALRPLQQDLRGIPLGIDMMRDTRAMIQQAFYLNRLRPFNPTTDPEMTAYQAGQIVQDWIRQAIPLFAPMETEYNGRLCELQFNALMRAGAFGPLDDMPPSLRGAEVEFRFESPLHDAVESIKGQKFIETKQLLAEAVALDPSNIAMIDSATALREALNGIRTPSNWMRGEIEFEQMKAMLDAQQQQAQQLAAMQQASEVASNLAGVRVPQE